MTVGPMEGVAGVISDINRELSGFAQTRLTVVAAQGDVILAVESVDGWPASGSFLAYGTIYTYAARSLTTLEGITWTDGATVFAGVKVALANETIITDLSRATNAMDLLRRAVLVDTADGAELNTVGRNLRVLRLPFLRDDARFRSLVRALAYNPRGTVHGLSLVLDALVGAGNYEIFEDVINYPNQVFIRLLAGASLSTSPAGRWYLRGGELRPSASTTQVVINNPVISRGVVTSVRLAPEGHTTDCRQQYPSADSIAEEYPGGPPVTPWAVVGASVVEGTHITLVGTGPWDGALEFTTQPPVDYAVYGHFVRMTTNAVVDLSMTVGIPVGAPVDTFTATGMTIDDGVRQGQVAIWNNGSTYTISFGNFPGIFGVAFTAQAGSFHEARLRKVGTDRWELYVDGTLVDTVTYTGMPVTSGLGVAVAFGRYGILPTSNRMQVRQVSYGCNDSVDYWSIRATDGVLTNPNILNSATGAFLAGDVGRQLTTRLSSNPIVNGDWIIYQRDSATQVRVRGRTWTGEADISSSNRITVNELGRQLFTYPDDIGKSIEILGSGVGNNGSYVITALLEPGTLVDFSTYQTPITNAKTHIAVVSASLTTENDVDWRLLPAFPAVGGVLWQMPGAGTVAGTTLTLRSPRVFPHPTVLEVIYAEVLSGQLLKDALIENDGTDYFPIYLTDLLGFLRPYLDDVTAAGVIPDYDF